MSFSCWDLISWGWVLFSQDACLRRLLEGLLIYSALLKHVEEECPSSTIPSEVRYYSNILIKELENKVGLSIMVTFSDQMLETKDKKTM